MKQGRVALGLVVLILLGKAPGQNFGPYPDIEDETFIKEYIDAHNKYRSEVNPTASNMRYMTFDIALASIAEAHGKKCIWGHNPDRDTHPDPKFRPFGENMWKGGASKGPFNISDLIRSFYQEVKYYDLGNNQCTHVCGHYTQVVWAESYKVGCAIVFCHFMDKENNTVLVVCDYAPAGNYKGVRPYKAGRSCSECAKGDTCQNNLCHWPGVCVFNLLNAIINKPKLTCYTRVSVNQKATACWTVIRNHVPVFCFSLNK